MPELTINWPFPYVILTLVLLSYRYYPLASRLKSLDSYSLDGYSSLMNLLIEVSISSDLVGSYYPLSFTLISKSYLILSLAFFIKSLSFYNCSNCSFYNFTDSFRSDSNLIVLLVLIMDMELFTTLLVVARDIVVSRT